MGPDRLQGDSLKTYRCHIVIILSVVLIGCASTTRTSPTPGADAASAPAKSRSTPRIRVLAERYFLNGSLLEMRKRYHEALESYRRTVYIDAKYGAAYFAMSKCFRALNNLDSARFYAETAVALDPRNVTARMHLVDLYSEASKYDSVLAQCNAVLELDPANIAAHFALAQLLRRRDPARAIAHYEYIRDNYGDDPNVLLGLAELYFNAEKYPEATETVEQLRALRPDEPTIYRLLVEACLKSGRFDSAYSALSQAELHLSAGKFEEFYADQLDGLIEQLQKGEITARGGLRFARQFLRRRDRVPMPLRVRLNRGLGLYYVDDADSLIADSAVVSALADTAATAREWLRLGVVYVGDRRTARFLRAFAPTSERYRRDGRVQLMLGSAYFDSYRNDSALKYLRRSLEIDHGNADAWGQLAMTHGRLGNNDACDSAYEQALHYDPGNPVWLNNHACLLAARGVRLDKALQMAKRAVEITPDNPSYIDTMGWIYFKMKDYRSALKYINQAIESGTGKNAEILEHLGDVQSALGNADGARDAYQRAFGLNPASGSLRQKLGR